MKRICTLLLLVVCALTIGAQGFLGSLVKNIGSVSTNRSSNTALSKNFTVKDINYVVISDNEVAVRSTNPNRLSSSLTIPETVRHPESMFKKYYVTRIEESAFAHHNGGFNPEFTTITLPSSLKSIGQAAFINNSQLQSICIPSGVSKIENSAFKNCRSLRNVTISYGVKDIENEAFTSCTSLQTISIPNSVNHIGARAFSFCENLERVKLPDGIDHINSSQFYGCRSLRYITIPETVKIIGPGAFSGCTMLTTIKIPSSVKTISEQAFYGCSSLSNVELPQSSINIGNEAFAYTKVTKIHEDITRKEDEENFRAGKIALIQNGIAYKLNLLEDNAVYVVKSDRKDNGLLVIPSKITIYGKTYTVTGINKQAFSFSNMTSVYLPETIRKIGQEAFFGCENLTSISIPASVMSIGDAAFANCWSLETITKSASTMCAANAFANTWFEYKKELAERDKQITALVNQYSRKYSKQILQKVAGLYKGDDWDAAHWALPIGTPLEFLKAYCDKFPYYFRKVQEYRKDRLFLDRPYKEYHNARGSVVVYVERSIIYGENSRYYEFTNGKLTRKYTY